MTQFWTIVETAGGAVVAPCFATKSTGSHPKDSGFPWDATKHTAKRIDKAPDPLAQTFNGTAWVDDVAKVRDRLITAVKDEAEQLKMTLMTVGGAKKAEYAEKRQEVIEYDRLATGVGGIVAQLTSLSTPRRTIMLAHATADAAAHGDTVGDAINRFKKGINESSKTPAIAAVEAATCTLLRAATSVAQLRAIYAARKWP